MPLYEYACPDGHHTDHFIRAADRNEPQPCRACGQEAKRVFSANVGFKMGRQGLLNTRNLPNDGVHGLAKAGRKKTFAARTGGA